MDYVVDNKSLGIKKRKFIKKNKCKKYEEDRTIPLKTQQKLL